MSITVEQLVRRCHQASYDAGWWHTVESGEPLLQNEEYAPYVIATKLLLTISEVIEGMEGHRKGDLMDDKLTHRLMLETELADAVIRICDLAGALNLDLAGAIEEKMAFNTTRPDHKVTARRAAGGKRY